jgi:hypothetical protein
VPSEKEGNKKLFNSNPGPLVNKDESKLLQMAFNQRMVKSFSCFYGLKLALEISASDTNDGRQT